MVLGCLSAKYCVYPRPVLRVRRLSVRTPSQGTQRDVLCLAAPLGIHQNGARLVRLLRVVSTAVKDMFKKTWPHGYKTFFQAQLK